MSDYDAIVVGAGIAGLGVASQLQKAGKKTLLLEMYPNPGGRTAFYEHKGYRFDIGLHQVEMGDKGYCHQLAEAVDTTVEWAKAVVTLDLYEGGKWVDMLEFIKLTDEEKQIFISAMKEITKMTDEDCAKWDNRAFSEWLDEKRISGSLRVVFENMSMIMTTIPDAREQAAGECLYIAREALQKGKAVLISAYPKNGMAGIVKPLVEAFERMGGTLKCAEKVEEVVFEGRKVSGVKVAAKGVNPIVKEWRVTETHTITAPTVVCALPIWHLGNVLDLNPKSSLLPEWWIKRLNDIKDERTGLLGYIIGSKQPLYEKATFISALKSPRTGLPFQGFSPTSFDPEMAPPDRYMFCSDNVAEPWELGDKFNLARLMELHWKDCVEMLNIDESQVELKIPYYTTGCDGLARKPGLVGAFKPALIAPTVSGLFFAGDTYVGRGLAMEGAAKSAFECVEAIIG